MKELFVNQLSHQAGSKKLFDQIDFRIESGEHVGIIGRNGTGKSTLLDIIAGVEIPDQGSVKTPSNYEISYLSQASVFPEDKTVLEIVFAGDNPLMRAVREYEEILHELSLRPEDSSLQKKLIAAQQRMDREDAWDAEAEAIAILMKLGIQTVSQQIGHLSGGQQKRVALAQALIQSPDLLILDEPTNHLDFAMIYWLEKYLKNFKGAFILVTHDRYFLDQVVDKIYELDHQNLTLYPGNYAQYMKLKSEQEQIQSEQAHKNKQLYKKELAWMREGVRARGTKQKARIDRFKDLSSAVKKSNDHRELSFDLPTPRLGRQVIEMKNASFSYPDGPVILKEWSKIFQKGDRIGITGFNGSGKSTFLDLITEQMPLDAGDLIIGETVRFGYYQQHFEKVNEDKRIIEYLYEIAQDVKTESGEHLDIPQLLERFLFPRSMHGARIRTLSGGEKRRLYLIQILMQLPNVLLLDEPTNDLDIDTLRVLEDFLDDFPGTVIAVSHDRYFLDRTANQLLIFEGNGQIREFYGYLNDYLNEKEKSDKQQEHSVKSQRKVKTPEKPKSKRKGLTYHELKEWQTIEDDIMQLEDKLSHLEDAMTDLNNNQRKMQKENGYIELMKMQEEKEIIEEQLLEKMSRWEYLSERL